MSVKLMGEVFYLDGLAPAPKLTLLALADNANDGGYCFPSLELLARKTGQSPRTVRRTIRKLERLGQVHSYTQPGRSSRYFITPCQSTLTFELEQGHVDGEQ